MLKKIRVALASVFLLGLTWLFLDFTGTAQLWFGWMAKLQFLPAVLAVNVGVVVLLVALTIIFGRIYCSVICPLGVFQDIVSWISAKAHTKQKAGRFSYKQDNPDAVSINLPSLGLNTGVYIYSVKIKSASSKYSTTSGKIIVTK